jgi:uncharacterized membrane protein
MITTELECTLALLVAVCLFSTGHWGGALSALGIFIYKAWP